MRTVILFFSNFADKKYLGKYKDFQWESSSYIMYGEVFPKIWDYSDEKYGSYGLLENNALCSVFHTCMNNFLTIGVFYRLNFPRYFFSAKVEKHELWRTSICY